MRARDLAQRERARGLDEKLLFDATLAGARLKVVNNHVAVAMPLIGTGPGFAA
jgi:hypothetical protein